MGESPGRLLMEVLLAAVAVGALVTGWNWRREALATDELILDLYQRIDQLEDQNEVLQRELDDRAGSLGS